MEEKQELSDAIKREYRIRGESTLEEEVVTRINMLDYLSNHSAPYTQSKLPSSNSESISILNTILHLEKLGKVGIVDIAMITNSLTELKREAYREVHSELVKDGKEDDIAAFVRLYINYDPNNTENINSLRDKLTALSSQNKSAEHGQKIIDLKKELRLDASVGGNYLLVALQTVGDEQIEALKGELGNIHTINGGYDTADHVFEKKPGIFSSGYQACGTKVAKYILGTNAKRIIEDKITAIQKVVIKHPTVVQRGVFQSELQQVTETKGDEESSLKDDLESMFEITIEKNAYAALGGLIIKFKNIGDKDEKAFNVGELGACNAKQILSIKICAALGIEQNDKIKAEEFDAVTAIIEKLPLEPGANEEVSEEGKRGFLLTKAAALWAIESFNDSVVSKLSPVSFFQKVDNQTPVQLTSVLERGNSERQKGSSSGAQIGASGNTAESIAAYLIAPETSTGDNSVDLTKNYYQDAIRIVIKQPQIVFAKPGSSKQDNEEQYAKLAILIANGAQFGSVEIDHLLGLSEEYYSKLFNAVADEGFCQTLGYKDANGLEEAIGGSIVDCNKEKLANLLYMAWKVVEADQKTKDRIIEEVGKYIKDKNLAEHWEAFAVRFKTKDLKGFEAGASAKTFILEIAKKVHDGIAVLPTPVEEEVVQDPDSLITPEPEPEPEPSLVIVAEPESEPEPESLPITPVTPPPSLVAIEARLQAAEEAKTTETEELNKVTEEAETARNAAVEEKKVLETKLRTATEAKNTANTEKTQATEEAERKVTEAKNTAEEAERKATEEKAAAEEAERKVTEAKGAAETTSNKLSALETKLQAANVEKAKVEEEDAKKFQTLTNSNKKLREGSKGWEQRSNGLTRQLQIVREEKKRVEEVSAKALAEKKKAELEKQKVAADLKAANALLQLPENVKVLQIQKLAVEGKNKDKQISTLENNTITAQKQRDVLQERLDKAQKNLNGEKSKNAKLAMRSSPTDEQNKDMDTLATLSGVLLLGGGVALAALLASNIAALIGGIILAVSSLPLFMYSVSEHSAGDNTTKATPQAAKAPAQSQAQREENRRQSSAHEVPAASFH
jgi:hypothetical protein